eukprot:SAG11_NODE_33765_length_275_cov_1.102273_1_plen_48_part_01
MFRRALQIILVSDSGGDGRSIFTIVRLTRAFLVFEKVCLALMTQMACC